MSTAAEKHAEKIRRLRDADALLAASIEKLEVESGLAAWRVSKANIAADLKAARAAYCAWYGKQFDAAQVPESDVELPELPEGVSFRPLERVAVVDAAAVPRDACSPDPKKCTADTPGCEARTEWSVTIR